MNEEFKYSAQKLVNDFLDRIKEEFIKVAVASDGLGDRSIEDELYKDDYLMQGIAHWAAFSMTSLYGAMAAQVAPMKEEKNIGLFVSSIMDNFEKHLRDSMQINVEIWRATRETDPSSN